MIIAVDIGNTNIVLGLFNNDELIFIERISTDHYITGLEYVLKFKSIFDLHDIDTDKISGCIISSVVPSVTSSVAEAIGRLTGCRAETVTSDCETGININIDNPQSLGSDQIADAVAAVNEYPLPAAVIDMGTATTISVIDKNKNYLGGMILPGLNISLDALTKRTSQLPKISLDPPKNIIGKNTVECMKSGILLGTAAQIDGMLDRVEEEMGEKVTAVATGGISAAVIPHCRKKIIHDNELLLKGLLIIFKMNS